jgi:hypothetical protein
MDLPAAHAEFEPVSGRVARDSCVRVPGVLRTVGRCSAVSRGRRPAVPVVPGKQAPPGDAWPARSQKRHEVHAGSGSARPGRCVAEVGL